LVRIQVGRPFLLACGVMVTQQTLTLSFQVRALACLPNFCSRNSVGSEYHATNVGVGGSSPSGSASNALVSLVVEVLFCKQGVVVRFHPGAPFSGVVDVVVAYLTVNQGERVRSPTTPQILCLVSSAVVASSLQVECRRFNPVTRYQ